MYVTPIFDAQLEWLPTTVNSGEQNVTGKGKIDDFHVINKILRNATNPFLLTPEYETKCDTQRCELLILGYKRVREGSNDA